MKGWYALYKPEGYIIYDKTAELYMNGLSYEEALMKAKELYGEADYSVC